MAFRAFVILIAALLLFALIALYRQRKMASSSLSSAPSSERFSTTLQPHAFVSDGDDADDDGNDNHGMFSSSYAEPYGRNNNNNNNNKGGRGPSRSAATTTSGPARQQQQQSNESFVQQQQPSASNLPRLVAPAVQGGTQIGVSAGAVEPSEPLSNEQYRAVSYNNNNAQAAPAGPGNKRLTTEDLLPKDAANSKWAQVTPSGQGELRDLNFMSAGWHIGVNTQGQSLRNANMQLRSDPINPQFKVSPWNMSTMEPDVSRRAFEIN